MGLTITDPDRHYSQWQSDEHLVNISRRYGNLLVFADSATKASICTWYVVAAQLLR